MAVQGEAVAHADLVNGAETALHSHAGGGGGYTPAFVQLAAVASNINAASTNNLVNWSSPGVNVGGVFTWSAGSSQRVTISGYDGWIEVNVNVSLNGAATRYNGRVKIRLNGSTVLAFRGKSGYIRNSTGHTESSLTIPGAFVQVADGDYLEILVDRESSNTSTCNSTTESHWSLKTLE